MPKRLTKKEQVGVVPADSLQWSEKSQKSLAFHFRKEYRDIEYNCWRCQKKSVFSANDQKHSFEVKKVYIDQHRILCTDCWHQALDIAHEIYICEEKWAESKNSLKSNIPFLSRWLDLLITREAYVPYKANTAAKNMLKKLLDGNL